MCSDQMPHGIMHLESVSNKGSLLDHVTEPRWLILRVARIVSRAPGHKDIPVCATTPSTDRAKHSLPLKGGKGVSALFAYHRSPPRQAQKFCLVGVYRLGSL